MRKLLAVAFAVAVGLSFAMGSDAEAAKKKVSVAKSKSCSAMSIEGKKVSFRCKASESCCYDGLMAKGNCVPAGQVCF